MNLRLPPKLHPGDTVAIVSLSAGTAGDAHFKWRTEQGIQRLEEIFDLRVKVMDHALSGSDYLYQHPEKRAEDLMTALKDPKVKGIISCIGGIETVRLLPYIDFNVIREHPTLFSGYSDTTTNHLMFYKAGVSSHYGPALLTDFAENIAMDDYTVDHIQRAWFSAEPIGEIRASKHLRKFGLLWDEENQKIAREYRVNPGYQSLGAETVATGHLLGGCVETLASLRGTSLFPTVDQFQGAILFLETSENYIKPVRLEDELRTYGIMGILDVIHGIIVGRPQDGVYYEEYQKVYPKVMKEFGREDLPILYNMNFGHNEPKCILPYGAQAQMNTITNQFKILDSGVRCGDKY